MCAGVSSSQATGRDGIPHGSRVVVVLPSIDLGNYRFLPPVAGPCRYPLRAREGVDGAEVGRSKQNTCKRGASATAAPKRLEPGTDSGVRFGPASRWRIYR